MKANAPEKIYLQHVEDGRLWPAWFTIKILNDDIEYVRTDAFIEKAYEYLSYHLDTSKIDVNYKFEFIEDFKNYLKGE